MIQRIRSTPWVAGAAQLGVQQVVGEQRGRRRVEAELLGAPVERAADGVDGDEHEAHSTMCRDVEVVAADVQHRNETRPSRAEPEAERAGLFRRMRDSLSKSRRAMTQQLTAVMFDPADPEVWERLEEALIVADCGVPATVTVIERLEAEADDGGLRTPEELRSAPGRDRRRADDAARRSAASTSATGPRCC